MLHFMVADSVEVLSKKAGEEDGWKWSSMENLKKALEKTEKEKAGTSIKLILKLKSKEFLEETRVTIYSKKIFRSYFLSSKIY